LVGIRHTDVRNKLNHHTTLKELVGPESHVYLVCSHKCKHLLACQTKSRVMNYEVWKRILHSCQNLCLYTVKVVNDAAERGVKLISDVANNHYIRSRSSLPVARRRATSKEIPNI